MFLYRSLVTPPPPPPPPVPHICVSELGQHWFRWLLEPMLDYCQLDSEGTHFSEIRIGIRSFSFMKMHMQLSPAKMAAILSMVIWVRNSYILYEMAPEWHTDGLARHVGHCFNIKPFLFSAIQIPSIQTRRSWGLLIYLMRIHLL